MVKVSDRVLVGSVSWTDVAASVEPREDQMAGDGRAEQLEEPPEGSELTVLSRWRMGQARAGDAVLRGTPGRAIRSAFLFSWGRDAD